MKELFYLLFKGIFMEKITELTLSVPGSTFAGKHATVYMEPEAAPRAAVLYFHGGGLVYGSRRDLPESHIRALLDHHYAVIAFDYPLAPQSGLETILADAAASVNSFLADPTVFGLPARLSYILWGRSAGAYLALLAVSKGLLSAPPAGILSYYGYGLLTDNWLDVPNPYYCTLPRVERSVLQSLTQDPRMEASPEQDAAGFSLYVFGRQSGSWPSLFFDGSLAALYSQFSLRGCTSLGCPLLCAHSMNDVDVPFSEFSALSLRFSAQRFIAPGNIHDFDRLESASTGRLLKTTLDFLDRCLA